MYSPRLHGRLEHGRPNLQSKHHNEVIHQALSTPVPRGCMRGTVLPPLTYIIQQGAEGGSRSNWGVPLPPGRFCLKAISSRASRVLAHTTFPSLLAITIPPSCRKEAKDPAKSRKQEEEGCGAFYNSRQAIIDEIQSCPCNCWGHCGATSSSGKCAREEPLVVPLRSSRQEALGVQVDRGLRFAHLCGIVGSCFGDGGTDESQVSLAASEQNAGLVKADKGLLHMAQRNRIGSLAHRDSLIGLQG